jgi:hypothetical protein
MAFLIGFGGLLFAQGTMDLALGFQYGTARVVDNGKTVREITEPGILLTFRWIPENMGAFGRLGFLIPSEIKQGDLIISSDKYDYILFMNLGGGFSYAMPITDKLSFLMDVGLSINDLMYGGSYKDNIDARWEIKIEQLGQTLSGGNKFTNVDMKESYNDMAMGIMINPAMRFRFSPHFFMELGVAASFDLFRFRSYEFKANFDHCEINDIGWAPSETNRAKVRETFPKGKLNDNDELILDSDEKFTVFKQFTFIPSLSFGFSF